MIDLRRLRARLVETLAEMADANNRRLELQTGLVLTAETAARRRREEIARLEATFARDVDDTATGRPPLKDLRR